MSRTNRFGFALIEVLIVIVIAGIVASIFIPNLISLQDREREQKIKLNAFACQIYVEDEAARMNGSYPDSVADALNSNPAMYENPFSDLAFVDGFNGWRAGVCYYSVADDRKSYIITANDRDGQPILVLDGAVH